MEKISGLISKRKKKSKIFIIRGVRMTFRRKQRKGDRKAKKEQKENHLFPVSFF